MSSAERGREYGISNEEVNTMFPGLSDAPMVVNDDRIGRDANSQLPSSATGRAPANDNDIDLRGRDMETYIRGELAMAIDPIAALSQFGRALKNVGREFGIAKRSLSLSLETESGDEIPLDDKEAERLNRGESQDATLDVIVSVLDNLEKTGAGGKSTESGRVMKEARLLLRIICDNISGVRQRNQQRSDKAGDSGMEYPPDGADAYKEASPAFMQPVSPARRAMTNPNGSLATFSQRSFIATRLSKATE